MRFATLVFCIGLFASCSPQKHELVISNVNIINVKTGEILPNSSVAIDGDSITAIYTGRTSFSKSTEIIDGTEKYLIPGLWDMHTHHNWNYKDTNPLIIANGIVGMREMWGNMYEHKRIKEGIANRTMDVPDIYTGSPIIDGKPAYWPGSLEVTDAEEARQIALEQIDSGVDFLKVYSGVSPEAFEAIAKVCKEKNVPFAGHVPQRVSIQQAARFGMESAEHLYGVSVGFSSKQDSIVETGVFEMDVIELLEETYSEKEFENVCNILIEEELWMCPTLVTSRGYANRYNSQFAKDERLSYMESYLINGWIGDSSDFKYPETQYWDNISKRYHDYNMSLIGKMHKKGVKFLAGSDYPNPFCMPGFSLHDELALLVEAGMDNLSVLQTATINPAIFMKKESKFGSVEVGKTASLVLLSKNPLEDIAHTKTIEAVFLRGKTFDKSQLTKMLELVKKQAQSPKYSNWLSKCIKTNGIDVAMDSLDILLASDNSPYSLHIQDVNVFGYRLIEKGEIASAVKVLEKCVELFPDEYSVYDSYAEALLANGQKKESLKYYQKLFALNPYAKNAQIMIDSLLNN